MSDSRLSTPSSSAGGRLPPIARPDWPWAGTFSQRNQQSSPHLGSMQGTNLQSGWEPRSSVSVSSNNSHNSFSGVHQGRNSTPKPFLSSTNFSVGESTRQWTFTVCVRSSCVLVTSAEPVYFRVLSGSFEMSTSSEILLKGLTTLEKTMVTSRS